MVDHAVQSKVHFPAADMHTVAWPLVTEQLTSIDVYSHTCLPAAVAGPRYQLDSTKRAQPCPAGTAKNKAGNSRCAKCAGRTYQPEKRQMTCKPCPVGKRVNAARTRCITYGPGVQPGRLSAPEKCPPGECCRVQC